MSAAGALDASTIPPPQEFGPTCAYHATMYRVSKVGLDIVRNRAQPMSSREQIIQIAEHRDALANIVRESTEYLRDSRKCTTPREMLEHWGLYLHSSYHMSELCRPAISPNADPELSKAFKQTCIENLVNTVEAYLGLANVVSESITRTDFKVLLTICVQTSFARQSWAALHRALGSALLLGIIGEHARNDRARGLIARLIKVMSDITTNLDPQEISAPIQRGLSALRKLSPHEVRTSNFVDDFPFGQAKDGAAVGEDGALKLDNVAMITPSASESTGQEEESSPFSVLNTILWGDDATRNPNGWSV